jgi:hypothetical protein
MTESEEEEKEVIKRVSGQDIGNPNPPSWMEIPHEGHKADAESWTRTKNKRYLKKRAQQLINIGKGDKALEAIVATRRH